MLANEAEGIDRTTKLAAVSCNRFSDLAA
jgi:hypothetical protein